ncbi:MULTISPECIES: phosphate regulon sensor histidine kinase PhoR [Methylomonas]|uniref:histidine kinase n=2 Tax=Methylomonas TaxID=416 RepID=A0A126T5V1_9GAMM|nr:MULTISPECIES: phosphate regulon sensor histidine kinase PhoR [Methylomonas]AMK77446.1 histidine kinase [Methylomonas denitrificans]OAI05036.1 histidine kinase [Methylomonas methanica]TCV84514.1 PAS/PAC sensor signal transduction histidine kinase [Methylomonas methanica]
MQRWQREINIAIALLIPAVLLSFFVGHFSHFLLAITLFLYIRQTISVNKLERWLSQGGIGERPDFKGIWGDIYYHLYKIRKSQKRRKKKLGKMLDSFRKSTSALPDAIVVLGAYGEIEWSNKVAHDFLGLKRSDNGQRIPNLVRHPLFVQYLKDQDYHNKICIPSPVNENMFLQIGIVPYGVGLRLLMAQDVTHLKNIERMRTDFVANVSHELRTPITVLRGYLETLQEMDEGNSPYTRSFQNMAAQTERMQVLIDDLLLLARLESKTKKFECVQINELLAQVCQESDLLERDERRVELVVDSHANVRGDMEELRSAFSNLLVNAMKYSQPSSPVKVSWRGKPDGGVYLEVEDFGDGIASFDIPRITERFYRAEVKRNQKIPGTGLGLAIVKHVLVRHDAKLEIESQLGKGSTFRCVFPRQRVC